MNISTIDDLYFFDGTITVLRVIGGVEKAFTYFASALAQSGKNITVVTVMSIKLVLEVCFGSI